jgi:hypothetical protein
VFHVEHGCETGCGAPPQGILDLSAGAPLNTDLRALLLTWTLSLGLVLPFLDKPVHIDDANFLVLARGAALDPWRPHALDINWQGTTERAFDVLSNPPGIGWWLAPMVDAPVWAQHLWMTPWLLLAGWGCLALSRAVTGRALEGGLVIMTAPVVALGAQALTPDLPLFACAVAGVGGFLGARRAPAAWAALAGCAALFRYSGLCLVPLLIYAGLQRGPRRAAAGAAAALPFGLLALHDLHAYGQVHFVAMTGFQGVANTPWETFRKGAAALAMLGGVGVLPLLTARTGALAGAALGGAVGLAAAGLSQQSPSQAAPTLIFCAAGGAAYGLLRARQPMDRLLVAWAGGGLLFLMSLRFAAARYWLPFFPALALTALRRAPPRPLIAAAVVANALVALGLSVDDRAFARAQEEAARHIAAEGQGSFAGHWGWQHYLEQAGWTALEDEGQPAALLAVSVVAWPQDPDPGVCLEEIERLSLPDRWWGPRAHTAAGAANLHAYLVAGDPPVETYAPWTFADDPYDTVTLSRRCEATP